MGGKSSSSTERGTGSGKGAASISKKATRLELMKSRSETMRGLPGDTQAALKRTDNKTRNFLLDTLRLGDAGILKL